MARVFEPDGVFQFTPLREGRRRCSSSCSARAAHFNSRPSARGDPKEGKGMSGFVISIHAPPRGATPQVLGGGCVLCISIHAPPRGATPTTYWASLIQLISIHAPPRGATTAVWTSPARPTYFNSRPSARGDGTMGSRLLWSIFQFTPLREGRPTRRCSPGADTSISIHAPPRGATPVSPPCRFPP